MTTRRWMITIAAMALILAVILCVQRRSAFLKVAERHERDAWFYDIREQRFTSSGAPALNLEFFEADGTVKPHFAQEFKRKSDYHANLGRKYRQAAASPWRAVEADPPEP